MPTKKSKKKLFKNNKIWELGSLLLLIVLIYFSVSYSEKIIELIQNSGYFAPILAILILTIFGITPLATDPIVILMGLVYGPFWGAVIGTIGNTAAMFLGYYFGEELAEIFEYEKEKKKLPKFIQKFPADSWIFLIFGRMIPGYGSKVVSLIAGSEKVNMKTYLWTSVVSGIFGAIILSYGGTSLVEFLK